MLTQRSREKTGERAFWRRCEIFVDVYMRDGTEVAESYRTGTGSSEPASRYRDTAEVTVPVPFRHGIG